MKTLNNRSVLIRSLIATTLIIGSPCWGEDQAECVSDIHLSSGMDDRFTSDALYSRSNAFEVFCGPFAMYLEGNSEHHEGEDFLAASYELTVSDWTLIPRFRASVNQPTGDPVREISLLGHRERLNLIVERSLNNEQTTLGGWFTDIPMGPIALDVLASARLQEHGEAGFEVAAGFHSKRFGVWAGYNDVEPALVFSYAANFGTAGLYGYSYADTFGGSLALIRFGFQKDGQLGGCYSLDWGLPIIRALQDVPPFIGNDGGFFQGGDWGFELGWVHFDEDSYAQALVGRRWVQWKKGKFSAAVGPRYDETNKSWSGTYEVRIDQSIAGQDVYFMVRGPDSTITAGISVAFTMPQILE